MTSKSYKVLIILLTALFCGSISFSANEEKAKSEIKPPEVNSAALQAILNEQQKVRTDYEEKRKDLQAQLQTALKDFKEEVDKPTRQDIIKENNQKQEELRESFKEQYRKLQAQERKLRFGRETLERPMFTEKTAPGKKITPEKQRRLDFQKRKEEQDRILNRNYEPEPQSGPSQALPLPLSPTPSLPKTKVSSY